MKTGDTWVQAHRTGSPAIKHHARLRRDIFVSGKMGGSTAGTPLLPGHQLELRLLTVLLAFQWVKASV